MSDGVVYLLHFDPAYTGGRKTAGHYLGYANGRGLRARLERHAQGGGSPLVYAALQAGCSVRLARVWRHASRTIERRLKNRKEGPRLCPICGRPRFVRHPRTEDSQ